jgi:subtilisin family serine protease
MQLRWTALAAATALTLAACTEQEPPVAPSISPAPALSVGRGRRARGHIVQLRERARPTAAFESEVEALGGRTVSTTVTGLAVVEGLTADAANVLEAAPDVLAIFPDIEIRLDPVRRATESIDVEAFHRRRSDFEKAGLYERQWNMDVIRAPAAWRAGKLGSSEVRVAILDTGIDPTHPDVAGLVDMTLSAAVSSVTGIDGVLRNVFFPTAPIWTDMNGHGTHVANTVTSDGIGTAGMTKHTRVIAVEVLSALGSGSLGGILTGLDYAASPLVNAHVINMSLGSFFEPADFLDPTDPDFDTIEEATAAFHELVAFFNDFVASVRAAGSVVVVSAGNEALRLDLDDLRYDLFCESVPAVCVSATGPSRGRISGPRAFVSGFSDFDEPAIFTNFGESVDLAAPGGNYTLNRMGEVVSGGFIWQACSRTLLAFSDENGILEISDFEPDICATSPQPLWAAFAGTSQAAPHVSGLAALLAAEVGNDKPDVIEQRLFDGSKDLGRRGRDKFFGEGRIDVQRTLGLDHRGGHGGHGDREHR